MLTFPTHFLVGAALSYLFGFSLLWGALGGMAPDLDLFTPWHRGPFHSIFMFPLMMGFAYLVTRSRKKSIGAGIGFAAHVLTDWLDRDTLLLAWPLSSSATGLGLTEWDDPFVNVSLCLLSVVAIIAVKKRREKRPWKDVIMDFVPKIRK
ncbi:MAG: metal-dependent hydrolase [Candidatus Aenigmarchaeota archaeon]|nr:metal-dependent hydrolase [Candidatus Aenigmarchaeota archaeon]